MTPLTWTGIAVLGALGALARFGIDGLVSERVRSDFPFGTLVVNLTGSFALGVLVGAAVSHRLMLVLGTGFLGGYTTFSTWMVESERLGEAGAVPGLLANLALSMLLGLGVAAAGWDLGRGLA